jgi:hypothetical protein
MHPGFPIVHDPEQSAAKTYGVEAIPANVVVDRSGKVIGSASDVEELKKLVAKLPLAAKAAPRRRAAR